MSPYSHDLFLFGNPTELPDRPVRPWSDNIYLKLCGIAKGFATYTVTLDENTDVNKTRLLQFDVVYYMKPRLSWN